MNSPWDILSLPHLADHIWGALAQAAQPGLHPWRTPVLSTLGPQGPQVRTVVLRGFTRPGFELIAFSDARASKVSELRGCPEASWLFYDPAERVQLRVRSTVRLHVRDPVAQTYWHRLPADQRCRYQSGRAPGTSVAQPGDTDPGEDGDQSQFAVLIALIHEVDWLWLGSKSPRRAVFVRGTAEGSGSWLEP